MTILSGRETLELVRADGRVCGAVITDGAELHYLGCKALVLATGGYGSLFRHHLCTSDVEGLGQALALPAGQYGVYADHAWLSVAGVSDHF